MEFGKCAVAKGHRKSERDVEKDRRRETGRDLQAAHWNAAATAVTFNVHGLEAPIKGMKSPRPRPARSPLQTRRRSHAGSRGREGLHAAVPGGRAAGRGSRRRRRGRRGVGAPAPRHAKPEPRGPRRAANAATAPPAVSMPVRRGSAGRARRVWERVRGARTNSAAERPGLTATAWSPQRRRGTPCTLSTSHTPGWPGEGRQTGAGLSDRARPGDSPEASSRSRTHRPGSGRSAGHDPPAGGTAV